jgi:hypothetical protein
VLLLGEDEDEDEEEDDEDEEEEDDSDFFSVEVDVDVDPADELSPFDSDFATVLPAAARLSVR